MVDGRDLATGGFDVKNAKVMVKLDWASRAGTSVARLGRLLWKSSDGGPASALVGQVISAVCQAQNAMVRKAIGIFKRSELSWADHQARS